MKKVVLIGDSIRMSYWERVGEILAGECEIIVPQGENCAYTMHTIRRVRDWFRTWGLDHVDLIHWNCGIWDHHRNTEDFSPFMSLEMYLSLQKRLMRQLFRYSDKLSFATTTCAGQNYNNHYHPRGLCSISREEWNDEIVLYNKVLCAYLKTQGVEINDIDNLVSSDIERFTTAEDGIHLSAEGLEAVSQQVAAHIRARLF